MVDRAQAPVHDLARVLDRAARYVGESLVAQADAEHRHVGATERVQGDTDVARVLRPAGPGEITTLSAPRAASSSHGSSSLRTTTGSLSLTSPRRWKRLNVYES